MKQNVGRRCTQIDADPEGKTRVFQRLSASKFFHHQSDHYRFDRISSGLMPNSRSFSAKVSAR